MWKVLVLLVVVVAGCSDSASSEAAPPADVEKVIASWVEANNTNDPELAEAILTDDFTMAYNVYPVGGAQVFDDVDLSRTDVLFEITYNVGWSWSQVGAPTTVGDGPWHVSVPEEWIQRDAGWEGVATYTVVDDDGEKLLAEYYFAGTGIADG